MGISSIASESLYPCLSARANAYPHIYPPSRPPRCQYPFAQPPLHIYSDLYIYSEPIRPAAPRGATEPEPRGRPLSPVIGGGVCSVLRESRNLVPVYLLRVHVPVYLLRVHVPIYLLRVHSPCRPAGGDRAAQPAPRTHHARTHLRTHARARTHEPAQFHRRGPAAFTVDSGEVRPGEVGSEREREGESVCMCE